LLIQIGLHAKEAYFSSVAQGKAMFGSDKTSLKPRPHIAHVIVCGNEKGGSGKSTLSMHLAVALLKAGHKVATIDLDTRQQTLTRYVENRRAFAAKNAISLAIPTHLTVDRAEGALVVANQDEESREFAERIASVEADHDFVIVDTPGSDTFLQRLAHLMADTLVTPINDSFVDFDVLAKINADTYEIEGLSQYAEAVRNARRERRKADGGLIDWVLIRNRLSSIQSRNEMRLEACVNQLASTLGFRIGAGVSERVIFRELFPIGLTAMDELDEQLLGAKPTLSHVSARNEIRKLVEVLDLPVTQKARERLVQRRKWLRWVFKPNTNPDTVLH
jgi:chromosome partitioning protein